MAISIAAEGFAEAAPQTFLARGSDPSDPWSWFNDLATVGASTPLTLS
jgi:hypothetical protein